MCTGHPNCVPPAQPVLATTAYDAPTSLGMERVLVCNSVRVCNRTLIHACVSLLRCLVTFHPSSLVSPLFSAFHPVDTPLSRH